MLIQLDDEGRRKQLKICDALGIDELLGQFCEECAEAIQAAQKVRRALRGTTPVSVDEAIQNLTEECGDAALCIDTLIRIKLVDENWIQFIGKYKNDRWHGRVCGMKQSAI